ncbi:Arc-like DNA binding domain protein [compost metagenome]
MKQAVYSSRTADKFVVRLPDGMREKVAEMARGHHRSMNSEIIARLEASLMAEGIIDVEEGVLEALPPEGWMPGNGQFVYKIAGGQKIYGTIKAIYINEVGEMTAKVNNDLLGNFTESLKKLRPVILK